MSEQNLYGIHGYTAMIGDEVRVARYREALAQAIEPGCTVLDLGAGAGLFSIIAATLGAAHVYAVEPANAIQIGRDIARDNGLDDRISFIQETAADVDLGTRVDVMVSDLRGVLPLFRDHIRALRTARSRWLAPTGTLIPQRDHIRIAIVEAPTLHALTTEPWERAIDGIDMSAGRRLAVNNWQRVRLGAEQLLSAPQRWSTLEYHTIEDADVAATVRCPVQRDALGHGIAAWFDSELLDGVGFSNAPGEPELIYHQAYFPWPHALELAAGDVVEIALKADLVGPDYLWRWDTSVFEGESSTRRHGPLRQSSFHGIPLSRAALGEADDI